MTDKTVTRVTLAKYAGLLGRGSTTHALLLEYDRALPPKPRIVMSNNCFRLVPRYSGLQRGHVVAIRPNLGSGQLTTVTVADVTERGGKPAFDFWDAKGRHGWAYQSAIVSVIKPHTAARGR